MEPLGTSMEGWRSDRRGYSALGRHAITTAYNVHNVAVVHTDSRPIAVYNDAFKVPPLKSAYSYAQMLPKAATFLVSPAVLS